MYAAFVAKRPGDLRVGVVVPNHAGVRVEVDHRSGHDEVRVVDAVAVELGEEHRLVGEDVRGVVVEVVERDEVVVDEARRPRAREHVRGLHPFDVLPRACHLVHALLAREAGAFAGREVVDDRVPDRAGELHEVRVVRTERLERRRIPRPGVVLVQHARRAVAEHQRRVPEGPVGGFGHGEDRDLEAVDLDRRSGAGADEPA